jgi:hypothetical protein
MTLPAARAISRHCSRNTSASGALGTTLRAFSSENTGVSSTLSRTYRPMPINALLIKNGKRHPHCINAELCSPMV